MLFIVSNEYIHLISQGIYGPNDAFKLIFYPSVFDTESS